MIECAANKKELRLPKWLSEIEPLEEPIFGTDLKSLRLHLLRNSPPPFRRRNIFIDNVNSLFLSAKSIREAAKRIAIKVHANPDWLNDAVKGYLSDKGEFETFLELSNLSVLVAKTEYLLAMKCLAMRIGEGLHHLDDVRYLLRYLNIGKYKEALEIIVRYYPKSRFPQKTLYALEELIEG